MQFRLPLLAVDDIIKSRKLYEELFDQTVIMDLGKNFSMSGGFALQEGFDLLTGIDAKCIINKSNNMELYFEADDFDTFMVKLESITDIEYIHEVKKMIGNKE